MVEFRVMDRNSLLTTCLHGGPVSLERLQNFQQNNLNDYLTRFIELYGSCAILAIENKKIVGFLRFYPEEIYDLMASSICIHQHNFSDDESKEAIIENLPPRSELSGNLKVQCIQVATGYYQGEKDYGNQGIGRGLYETLEKWAKKKFLE